jgi:hypothetical protein
VRELSSRLVGAASGEFYNLGMSAASVEDYVALWSILKSQGKIPAVAVFSVDAWIFSRSNGQVRWLALAPEVSRFLDAARAGGGALWLPGRDALYLWLQAREYLSFSVLAQSIRDLDRLLARRRRQGDDLLQSLARDLVPEEEVAGRNAIRADGSVIRPGPTGGPTTAEVRAEAVRYVATGAYALRGFRWDDERAARLDLLWRDMRAAGVTLVAYTPTYHPTAWALLREEPAYAAALDSTAAFLRGLAARTGARFVDLSDPASIPCGEGDFYDAHHPKPACLARIWQRLEVPPTGPPTAPAPPDARSRRGGAAVLSAACPAARESAAPEARRGPAPRPRCARAGS